MSLFVFKNLFLRRDLFLISLFMKGAWFAQTYRFFLGAYLWIASSRAALNRSNSRLLFSEVIWIILFLTSNINASLEKGPSIKDIRTKGPGRGQPNAESCGQGGRGLVKWGCPHFEKVCKFIFEMAQAENCLCNSIQVTCYLTTPKSYLGIESWIK